MVKFGGQRAPCYPTQTHHHRRTAALIPSIGPASSFALRSAYQPRFHPKGFKDPSLLLAFHCCPCPVAWQSSSASVQSYVFYLTVEFLRCRDLTAQESIAFLSLGFRYFRLQTFVYQAGSSFTPSTQRMFD